MAEIERPALGSPEAAVRSMVNLIATAARVDEEQLAYWLDAYYQLRAAYEHADEAEPFRPAVPPDLEILEALGNKLDAVAKQVENSMGIIGGYFINISGALLNDDGPSRAPAPTEEQEGGRQMADPTEQDWKRAHNDAVDALAYAMAGIAPAHAPASVLTATLDDYAQAALGRKIVYTSPAPTEADETDVTDNNVGNKAAEAEEPTPAILKSSRVLPSADQAAIQSKKRTRSQEAAAADKSQRDYKMRVADRLRQVRANGVTTAQIVEAGHGSVPDGAVLGIVGGEFRPIADYRAIEAALDELETR